MEVAFFNLVKAFHCEMARGRPPRVLRVSVGSTHQACWGLPMLESAGMAWFDALGIALLRWFLSLLHNS